VSTLFGGGTRSVAKSATRAMGIDLQGAQYGAPISVVFGQNKTAGNVVSYLDFKATGHQQQQPGKGGGGQSSTSYTYSASFQLGLCEGPANVINVYQGSSTVSLAASGGIAFSGALGQAPWAHLTGAMALGYSGTALACFQNLQLGSTASLPNFNFEMAGRNQFGGGIVDANPADIMTAICTDTQIGVSFGALGDLTNFKNYCTAAGLFFSPVYATQNPAQQSLGDLLKYANSATWFSEGKLKVQPYGDATITGNGVTYTPNLTAVADLGRDDFITNGPGDPVTIHRVAPSDARNIVRLEYKDRANTYHTGAVVASIDQDVVASGSRADQSESADMITTAPVARLVVQNLLQRIYYIRNTYDFQLSWRYCYLEPMDVVTLTDANTGLYLTPVRITDISEDDHGLLSVTAEEFPIGTAHGSNYGWQPNAGTNVDANTDPGPVDGPYLFRGPGFLVSNATPEIWCAVTGNAALWAGCDVYLSNDGTSYTYLTTTSRKATYGATTNALPSAADPDITSAPNVVLNGPAQLLGGTAADADQFVTLAMVDQEIIAYQTATLASGPSYTLGYLRRGGYGSAIVAHASSAPFVRLDENILRIPVDPSQIGQTVYLKFVSFNAFGKGGRTLAVETAYPYVIGTNVELPDVPIAPSSFAVLAVADGVNLTWTNANPAAVNTTSIEYAIAGTGPWTVLAQVGPTATSFPHHFTTGSTYYYRMRSRGPLVSAGWSGYTSILSSTGVNVSANVAAANAAAAAAQTSANAANTELANIASDNVVSAAEKPTVIRDYSVVTAEQAGIDSQAVSFLAAGSAQQVAYDNAITALTSYLGGLTSPKAWNDKTGDTTVVGATFRANFNSVYTTRQTLLNAIYAKAQTLANNAQGTANTANTTANNAAPAYVINPGFDLLPAGLGWSAGTGWTFPQDSAGPGAGAGYAKFTPTGSNAAIYNQGRVGVVLGQTVKAQALIRAASANGVGYVRIQWLDSTGTQIAVKNGNTVTGSVTTGSYAVDQAPTGALYAAVMIEVDSCTTGTYQVDNVVMTLQPNGLGEVPDTGGRYGVHQVDVNGLALIDFTQSGHVSKNLDNIGDGPTYGRMYGTDLTGNRLDFSKGLLNKQLGNIPDGGGRYGVHAVDANSLALVDFSQTGHVNKNLDNMGDGATYQRMPAANMDVNRRGLVDFSQAMHLNKNLDNLADGTSRFGAVYTPTVQAGIYAPGSNMVRNPSFALGSQYWTLGAGWGVTLIYSENSIALALTTTATTSVSQSNSIAVLAGVPLALSADVFSTATFTAGDVSIDVQYFNAGGSSLGGSPRLIVLTTQNGGFVRYTSALGATPANTASCYIRVFIEGASAASGAVYVRRIKLEVGGTVTPFDDIGTQTGNQLGQPGSGQQIGDQRNLLQRTVTNYPAKVPTVVSVSTAAGTPATATISVAAFTVLAGSVSISYNAMSASVTGTNGAAVVYYLYCNDPTYAGGTKTLVATTTATDVYAGDGYVFIGSASFTYPTSGTGGGGGSPPCVTVDSFVRRKRDGIVADVPAGEVIVGDYLRVMNPITGVKRWGRVSYSQRVPYECVQVTTEHGVTLSCSMAAEIPADDLGQYRIGTVTHVEPIGVRDVQHITCEDDFFLAGDQPCRYLAHHNKLVP
jgi:hypothetical protein